MCQLRYHDYGTFFKSRFNTRVQKLSIDAGFTCPNIDGSKGKGGCTYCINKSFKPDYVKPFKPILQQIEEGMAFFAHKKEEQKYLAYFQSHSNTYGEVSHLKALYEEALSHPDVIGLVISTRPDCITEEILLLLDSLAQNHFVALEFGVESTNNQALQFVNRCDTFEATVVAIKQAARFPELYIGAHLIMGLPFDDYNQCVANALKVADLPIQTLKFHQLQILKGTVMSKQYEESPEMFNLFTEEIYLKMMVEIIEQMNPNVRIDRFLSQVPPKLLIAPQWKGVKNFEFANKVNKELIRRDSYQGKYYNKESR